MTAEYDVAAVTEVPVGGQIIVHVRGREIGVFNVRGSYYALPNVCIHQNGPLCRGAISGTLTATADTEWKLTWVQEGEIIVCPWHSLEYHIPTGQCLAYRERRLPTYPVKVDGDRLKVVL